MDSSNEQRALLSEDHGLDLPPTTLTLHQILNASVNAFPENIALVSCHQSQNSLLSSHQGSDDGKEGCLRWLYNQLQETSKLLAAYLSKNGMGKGDKLIVVTYGCAEWVISFWAAARLGCPFVPINPAIVHRAMEIKHVLSTLKTIGTINVTDESIAKPLSRNAPFETDKARIRLILSSNGTTGWISFANTLATSELPKPPNIEQQAEDTVLIVLISGTTTLPKVCPQSNRTVASMCERHRLMYRLDETRISCNHYFIWLGSWSRSGHGPTVGQLCIPTDLLRLELPLRLLLKNIAQICVLFRVCSEQS